ncbi:MAG TPA: iron ABC transporter permease [Alphaproteobacteria bacterium]|nr:iron ABC transporter permease [Alphaproteobacteria bacterium]
MAALLCLPLVSVAASLLQPSSPSWADTAATVMPRYVFNSILLGVIVGIGVSVVGTVCAWLVVMYRFAGRPILEVLLALPLAMPAYVMAYALAHTLQYSGPVQSELREAFGWGPQDYWFPNVRSVPGAAMMLIFTLYPYVYLLARASFIEQSVCALEVGRSLGRGPVRLFWDVALPLARPAILAGAGLAVMETLADYGTVDYLGVQTFTTGIYRAYFSLGDAVAAAQLASALVGLVAFVAIALRVFGGRSLPRQATARYRPLPTISLGFGGSLVAIAICLLPPVLGFAAPVTILISLAVDGSDVFDAQLLTHAINSFGLALGASSLAVLIALGFAYARRITRSRLAALAASLATFNYAVPGSVIAIGLIVPFAWADARLAALFGDERFLLLSGSIAGLVFLYIARFFAAAHGAARTSLARVTYSMDWAARSLGATPLRAVMRVHLPVMGPSLLTGVLIVFLDVMKELPGTLILRPFNFDTLAIATYHLASDERISELAAPALAIVAAGLLPLAVMMHAIARGRAGSPSDEQD